MKTIKIIDLLNKIANGEEVPQKINFDGQGWYLEGKQYSAIDGDGANIWSGYNFNILNDEVEIIEEDKEIEPLEYEIEVTRCPGLLDEEVWNFNNKDLILKINELIDKVNSLEKKQ